jgi:DNA-directed RNA polymerase subunit RPC12/RpoP
MHGLGDGQVSEIKLIPAVCPRCGGNLRLPDNLQKAFCTYCGTEILIGKTDAKQKVECYVCDGFGRVDTCRACEGTGRCSWTSRSPGVLVSGIPVTTRDAYCADGFCSLCGGKGRKFLAICPACDGTGRCPRCMGTGKCSACRGVGFFPSRNGAQLCGNCKGTGLMEPGAPRLPGPQLLVGTCPNCGKKWQEGLAMCPNCGYMKRQCPGCGEAWATGATSCSRCGFGRSPKAPAMP